MTSETLRELLAEALYCQAARFSTACAFPPWESLTQGKEPWMTAQNVDALIARIRAHAVHVATVESESVIAGIRRALEKME